ncbi:hypothetical protein CRV24_006199 [Beauveria bassiana]|uniref:Small secreted protein n=1 Tax=Beauveria bassiana (strain ARSEF 2860) TaxID=655819 RepID=J5JCA9_BEAB2|nr:uncharacterized protein BBA_07322 [Beauveria bassiana ARSEF 2860]EJP63678.1 hypothetical protein BBA_07322 [Beauveria bassiana ARSEF 2860]KAF1734657.1 hypothetical protein CRV24_006199 [Beauveria bassiana]KAH8708803.1 hypothetical protein HC256_008743 [Beauveria bassiana]
MKAAVLFLAALASASPMTTRQARAQNGCDCSKNFHLSLFEQESCPEGYADVSAFWDKVECDQIGCTQQDHNVQCGNVIFQDDE